MKDKEINNKSYILMTEDDILPLFEKAVSNVFESRKISVQEKDGSEVMGDLVTQEEAMKILGRKTTWFYNMRTTGKLTAIKSANKWWYKKEDIREFVKNGRS